MLTVTLACLHWDHYSSMSTFNWKSCSHLCLYSLPRLWSSWIPNFSQWLTWLKPTGSNGRSWIRRDNTTTARLHRRAPAAPLTAPNQAAAPWPKQAVHPAAAAARCLRTLVSFWRRSVLLFFWLSPLLLGEACDGGSACRGSRAVLLLQLGFMTWARRHQTSQSCVGHACQQFQIGWRRQVANSEHCVNMSIS